MPTLVQFGCYKYGISAKGFGLSILYLRSYSMQQLSSTLFYIELTLTQAQIIHCIYCSTLPIASPITQLIY